MKQKRFCLLFILLIWFSMGVFAQDPPTLTVVTHSSFSISEEVLAEFEAQEGVRVVFVRLGDTGQLVNQSILSRNNPLGDVLFGVDDTFLSRALEGDLFVPYQSPLLQLVNSAFITEEQYRVTPISYGDVCLNYDIAYFEENNLALPETLVDLVLPQYKGLLVAQNPATSSPGLAFLLTTIAEFGTEGDYTYLDFWQELVANDVLIVDGWDTAYFTYFTAGSEEGEYPMVVSYASSPPFTVDETTQMATTASLVGDGMCYRQVEYAGILAGTEQEELAQKWIDFMLSESFQADVPMQMYVFPARDGIALPEVFAEFAQLAEVPAIVDASLIEEKRDEWIQAWTETILR